MKSLDDSQPPRKIKKQPGFEESLAAIHLSDDRLTDALEYSRTALTRTPEEFPPVAPNLNHIRLLKIQGYTSDFPVIHIWFTFDDKTVTLLEAQDPDYLG